MSYCALCLKDALKSRKKLEPIPNKLDSYCTWHLKRAQKLTAEEVKKLVSKGRERFKVENPDNQSEKRTERQKIYNFNRMVKQYSKKQNRQEESNLELLNLNPAEPEIFEFDIVGEEDKTEQ